MPMPAIQAVLRSQLQIAAGGNVRAQRDVLAMIGDIELVRDTLAQFDNGRADDVDDTDDVDADAGDSDDNNVDDTADADRDDAGAPMTMSRHGGRPTESTRTARGGRRSGNGLRRCPQPAPRGRKTPRPRRPGLRYRPAQNAGNGKAFCPAGPAPDGARASSLHGRNLDGAAAVPRSAPAKPEGVLAAFAGPDEGRTDPAQPAGGQADASQPC